MAVPEKSMSKKALRLHPRDNCVVALENIRKGDFVAFDDGTVVARNDVELGHKISISSIKVSEKIYKYGAVIGSATVAIEPGDHIHIQNLTSDYLVGFHH